jgi:regulator of sigma E protease
MGILYMLIAIVFMVFTHELGHFMFAKLFGVGVHVFSLGFGPKVLGFKKGETEYKLCMIPLGGYVKLEGDDPELNPRPDKSFNLKPKWEKAIIIAGGVAMNFICAILLIAFVNWYGMPALAPVIGKTVEGMPAYDKLEPGDRILEVNGTSVRTWDEATKVIMETPESGSILLKVERKGETLEVGLKPKLVIAKNLFGENVKVSAIGVEPDLKAVFIMKRGLTDAAVKGIKDSLLMTKLTAVGLWKMVTGGISAKDNLGGPIMIVSLGNQFAKQGITSLTLFVAIILINLVIINLIPLPILDGGLLLLLAIEATRGKPLNEKLVAILQNISWLLIISLIFFVFYLDFSRLLKR